MLETDLRQNRVYFLTDDTLVRAVEVKPKKWRLLSINDAREFEIRPDGSIHLLPMKICTLDDLVDARVWQHRPGELTGDSGRTVPTYDQPEL